MARSGPCSPWIQASDVLALPSVQAAIANSEYSFTTADQQAIAAEACAAASEILFAASARIFTGECGPVTVRPAARPVNEDGRKWLGGGGSWGVNYGAGGAAWYGLGAGGVAKHFGDSTPPEIPLPNHPVNKILLVKIDGVVIPSAEYELRGQRTLVRIRPSAASIPTERWGWPTSQIGDLPDTEMGTFSVTYTYGQDPGGGGRKAAKKLAEVLVLPDFGDPNHYPTRLTSISRQGISAAVTDVMDLLAKGQLGIYEVDSWLMAVNPSKARRQSVVWSPDLGRSRRQQNPSTS